MKRVMEWLRNAWNFPSNLDQLEASIDERIGQDGEMRASIRKHLISPIYKFAVVHDGVPHECTVYGDGITKWYPEQPPNCVSRPFVMQSTLHGHDLRWIEGKIDPATAKSLGASA